MTRYANITPAGARKRLFSAAGTLMLAITGAWMMVQADLDRTWRLLYFPGFWLVGLGLFQAWEGT
jgi:uncharacterized membrane protein